MSLRRSRILLAAVMSSSLLVGLAVAGSSGATTLGDTGSETSVVTTSETVTETSVAATADTVADMSVATTPDMVALEILPPDESWAGLTRGELDARWWQWWLSLALPDVSPGLDAMGERCGYGQFGPVFFLPGNLNESSTGEFERTCVVAEGTAIYVAAAGGECSTIEPPPFFGRTEDELRACAEAWVDAAIVDVSANVNGRDIDLDSYRTSSPLFTLTYPEGNIYGQEPGVGDSVSDTYSFIIAPPPAGEHQITTSMRYAGEAEPFDLVYNLIVEAPQVIEPPTNTEAQSTRDSAPASLAVDGSAEASSPAVEAFCTATVATENAVASGDPELIAPAVEAVEAAAPDDEVRAIVDAVSATFQAGGPEFLEAYAELIDYIRANCGFAQLDLTASEYVFNGFPAELPAGPIIVSLDNVGTEVHELTFIRFNDDVTLTADELFALPAHQQQAVATFTGIAYVHPGEIFAQLYDLAPGRYLAVCTLPENADPEIMSRMEVPGATEPEDADFGPPHYTLGMIHEFTAT